MAARYWVGTTGDWTDTAHWSATSGGAGGASVPTSADAVTVNASSGTNPSITNSTFTTPLACASLTVTAAGTTINLGGAELDIYGNLSIAATTTITNGNFIALVSTTASSTISTNNSPNLSVAFIVQPTGSGTYSLATAYQNTAGLTINGPFSTAGFALTCSTILVQSGSFTAGASAISATTSFSGTGGTLTLNSCTITTAAFSVSSGTVTAGTSTIAITSSGSIGSTTTGTMTLYKATFSLGGSILSGNSTTLVFSNTVTVSGGAGYSFTVDPVYYGGTGAVTFSSTVTIASGMPVYVGQNGGTTTFTSAISFPNTAAIGFAGGSTAFNGGATFSQTTSFAGTVTVTTLTLTSLTTGAYVYSFDPAGSYTVSTSLVASGSSGINRIRIASSTVGSAATISAAATTLTDVDFADITKAGAGGWSGTRIGNAGGNTGITFTATKNVFLSGTTGYNVTAGFSLTSGGAVATTNIPLPQDTLTIDNASGNSGVTVTFNATGHIYPGITASSRTVPLTISTGTVDVNVYGSLILSSSLTLSGATTFYLMARSASSLTAAGVTITQSITISGTATYTLGNILTVTGPTGVTMGANGGSLNLSTYSLTAFSFTQSGGTFTYNTQNTVTLTGYGTILSSTAGTQTGTGTLLFSLNYSGSNTSTVNYVATESTAPDLNVTTGTYPLTISGSYRNMNFTGYAAATNGTHTIYGDLTISTGMTITSGNKTFAATSGTKTITTNGVAFNGNVTFNGAGGTFNPVGALNLGAATTRLLTLTAGAVNLAGYAVTAGLFSSSGTGTRSIDFAGSSMTLNGSGTTAFNTGTPTNLTVSNTGTTIGSISMTSATAKTFAGGGATFPVTLNQGGTGALTLTGANTFYKITNSTQPTSILFTPSTTTTLTNGFLVNGTAGNLVTIGTVGNTGTFTLSLAVGVGYGNYLSLSRSTATGGAFWYAGANSTNGGNNTGWVFSTYIPNQSGFLVFFI
jgi:hypothetical protein